MMFPRTIAAGLLALSPIVDAFLSTDAEAVFQDFNNAFLVRSNNGLYYKVALNNGNAQTSWTGALNILAAEDAYERTGDPDKKQLVSDLLNYWLQNTYQPWTKNYWNDDLGWYALALIRGYRITEDENFLNNGKYAFDLAFGRGWTPNNGGGIWERQPEDPSRPDYLMKEALSNDSLGKAACMLYQSTHDDGYKQKCRQIYDWVRSHIYNSNTGQMNRGVYENGTVDTSSAAYNQGTWIDYANLVWLITSDKNVYNDAEKSVQFAQSQLTENGIFSKDYDGIHTWADEAARGIGNFARDNRLWDKYYTWMVQNADTILKSRRSDLGIAWNAWAEPTPHDDGRDSNQYAGAVAWLQYTPVTKPGPVGGIRVMHNKKTAMAIDSAGTFGMGAKVIQWGPNPDQNQKWQLSQNTDGSWNIVSMSTWEALDCPDGTKDNGATMVQYRTHRNPNQRWWIDDLYDGSYKITNVASGKVLDGGSTTTNGDSLIQWEWNGQDQQRWVLY